jgi:flagellar basal-body rod protein FlgB
MFISSLTERGAGPALVHMWSYTQARHKMIAENVANWGNPNYKTKQLDAGAFQQALGQALDARGRNPAEPLVLPRTDEFHTDEQGRLGVTPTQQPVENILFHDGTNMFLERQMADLAENAMMHEAVTTLLQGRFTGLRKAIRGQL